MQLVTNFRVCHVALIDKIQQHGTFIIIIIIIILFQLA
jgi:hypothetical protein